MGDAPVGRSTTGVEAEVTQARARAWAWRKSSRSAAQDNCVEVACTGTGIRVRDSKCRRGGVIALSPSAWTSFLRAVDDASPARQAEA
ncbi:DUF397 domain-containing protein [Streptomyces cellulosae]|nr:DUF397 domain-containing protein [Streptomyces sp. McG7]MDX3413806.1 DUF397 domain-containing protein [Streptomyces sp. MD20-1-1]MYW50692.1 DUF397 domain-containing protein [Streptomyces sp. SID8376]THC52794.1 DUF397 domain-containing protein [Streptomyces sp. Akac8]WSB91093.1 DUF397 domain-containing protein [Streptomyces cellulosae]